MHTPYFISQCQKYLFLCFLILLFESTKGEQMSIYFHDYDKLYPELVVEILEYFEISNATDGKPNDKSIRKFCAKNNFKYQPVPINRICKRLCECNHMDIVRSGGFLDLDSNYVVIFKDKALFESQRNQLSFYFNSVVYGFEYIYRIYKGLVVPLVWERENGEYSAGTGFKFKDGIVTAKHCVTDVTNLQIKGYKAEDLEGKPIYISENEGVDLAFIETGKISTPILLAEEGEIMQEVIVMGYPKIPAFTQFLTAEKATISSKASSRITPTKGAIAAYGYEYLSKIDAMLITARIRGGNSGGPIINQNGCLVGVACHIPDANPENGDYDDMGYGVAIPVSYLLDLIDKKSKQLPTHHNFFKDFIE